MRARRRLPPIPIEPIRDSAIAATMPTIAYGALMRLLHHFWENECHDVPDCDLSNVARVQQVTWRKYAPVIVPLFRAITSDLERWRARRDATMATLESARRASQIRKRSERVVNLASKGGTVVLPQAAAPVRQERASGRIAYRGASAIDTESRRFTD